MAGHPLRPARDRRLGGPLPRLLANPIWVHPIVRGPKVPLFGLATLCGISHRFQWLSPSIGQIPRHYSPVRHSSPKSKLSVLPSDLHVLGLPPAFNLSHDQTLQLKVRFASTREAMLKENVVMNFNTCSLLRLDIFLRPETLISILRVPTQIV